jgi:uncharacterized membrane protein (UPF0127 family)
VPLHVLRSLAAALVLVAAGACATPAAGPLDHLPVVSVRAGTTELRLALAEDRTRGLAGIDGLGALDGMLFDYGAEVAPDGHPFWMSGVRFPLEIAFFAADGRLVDRVTMTPCPDGIGCPSHVAAGPFRWVVETPPGTLGDGGLLVHDVAPGTT